MVIIEGGSQVIMGLITIHIPPQIKISRRNKGVRPGGPPRYLYCHGDIGIRNSLPVMRDTPGRQNVRCINLVLYIVRLQGSLLSIFEMFSARSGSLHSTHFSVHFTQFRGQSAPSLGKLPGCRAVKLLRVTASFTLDVIQAF